MASLDGNEILRALNIGISFVLKTLENLRLGSNINCYIKVVINAIQQYPLNIF